MANGGENGSVSKFLHGCGTNLTKVAVVSSGHIIAVCESAKGRRPKRQINVMTESEGYVTLKNANVAAFDVVGCSIVAAGTCAFGGRMALMF